MSLIGLMVGATIAVAAPRSIAGLPAGEPRVDLSTIEHQTTFVQTENCRSKNLSFTKGSQKTLTSMQMRKVNHMSN